MSMSESTNPEPGTPEGAHQTLGRGRYVLVRPIAEGGTAQVSLGYDAWSRRWCAIKTLLPEYSSRPSLRHRFEVEARTMSSLEGRHVVQVYDTGIDGDVAYMAMEFCEGGSVVDWIERFGPMPPQLATRVAIALCEGIADAHQRGIIHRDVKPQNLLIAGDGTCKVTDFGIAQVVESTRVTMTGMVMGTVGYMAPEQHESAKHIDERADIYSAAATLFTLSKGVAATHLFMAEDKDFDGIPVVLADVIRKGAQYRREHRHGSIREMIDALQDCLQRLPDDPPDTPPLAAASPFVLADIDIPTLPDDLPTPIVDERLGEPAASLGSIEPPAPTPAPTGTSEGSDSRKLRLTRTSASGHKRVVQPYGHGIEEQARRRDRRMFLALAAFVLVLSLGALGWLAGVGQETLVKAEQQILDTRRTLYAAVLDERDIVRELQALDVDTTETERLLDAIEDGANDQNRFGDVLRLQRLLHVQRREGQAAAATRLHILRSVDSRLERIDAAIAHEAWVHAQFDDIRTQLPAQLAELIYGAPR